MSDDHYLADESGVDDERSVPRGRSSSPGRRRSPIKTSSLSSLVAKLSELTDEKPAVVRKFLTQLPIAVEELLTTHDKVTIPNLLAVRHVPEQPVKPGAKMTKVRSHPFGKKDGDEEEEEKWAPPKPRAAKVKLSPATSFKRKVLSSPKKKS